MRLKELCVGMTVHWTDPDNGVCSCDGKIASISEDYIIITTTGGGEVHALPKELSMIKDSMDWVMWQMIRDTYNVIGTDLGWDAQMPKASTVREVVCDSIHPSRCFGRQKEAAVAFCAMSTAEKSARLKATLP